MDEYIERELAIEALSRGEGCGNVCRRAIERIISADVVPVRHGRWILEREPDGKPYCFHCSVCDDDFHYIGITVAYDYCPNCGAKMDGSEISETN